MPASPYTPTPTPLVAVPDLISPVRTIGARRFDFARQVAVMGVVNRTPDSFHDRGRTFALAAAVDAGLRLAADGADWLDFGGVPFGLHAGEISEAEEADRILPLVEAVRARTDVVISVDTFRPAIARAAVAAGADVINDTSGLRDPDLAAVVAETGATVVVTHSLAWPPRTPVPSPAYADVTTEVRDFLAGRVRAAEGYGIKSPQIIVDPGHDLNKNTVDTLAVTRNLAELTALRHPLLVAVSNKDFIGETLAAPQDDRQAGTLAALTFCVTQGARIVRVHDVRAAVHAVRMVETILGWREPVGPLRHNL